MKTIDLKSGTKLPLMNLKGKDYLQVAYRLVWFREEHPDWSIETEFLSQTDQSAVCKATVKDTSGRVITTSHKEESSKDFAMGHREKAETGAIGRALALCGYGTQFEPDFDEESRVVDSPIGPDHNPHAAKNSQPEPGDGVQPDLPACDCGAQLKFTQKKSGRYPDGCWYCPNFKNTAVKHVEPVQPADYDQWKKEMVLYALDQAREQDLAGATG